MSLSVAPLSTTPLSSTLSQAGPGESTAGFVSASYFIPFGIFDKKQAVESVLASLSSGATLSVICEMSGYVANILSAQLSFPRDAVTGLQTALLNMSSPVNSIQSAQNEMPSHLRAVLATPVSMSTPITCMLILPVSARHTLCGMMTAPIDIGPKSVIICDNSYSIVSGAANLDNLTIDLEIKQDLDSAHSSFTLSSITPDLYNLLNAKDLLTVTIDAVLRQFIVEEIGMPGDMGFSIWGRSVSCLLDTPHADQVTIETDGSQGAADLAQELTGYACWHAADYPLPDGWSMTGTPVEILIRLAQTVGAVVQPTGTGLEIVPRFKNRPVEWSGITPEEFYNRDQDILSLSWDDEAATKWSSVTVVGRSTPWLAPIIEIVEQSPVIGDAVHVDVYKKGNSEESFNSMVTAGTVALVEDSISTIINNEVVTFSEYRSSLKYPVDELLSFRWIGDNRGSIYWLDGGRSTELELAPGAVDDTKGYGIAEITYRSSYDRYRLEGHHVNELMLIMSQSARDAVKVRLKVAGLTLPVATDIEDELITTAAAAVARGTSWLDSSRYDKRKISMSAPHKASAAPGAIISIADEIEGVSGSAMITTRSIKCSGVSVIDTMGVDQCLF